MSSRIKRYRKYNNIIMLLYGHFPNDNRPRKEAISINKAGFNVTVYCLGFPNEQRTETIYQGSNHIKIRRLIFTTSISRINPLNMILFWIMSMLICIKENRKKTTIIHSHDLTALPIGYLISFLLPSIIIYDSHELFPETAKKRLGTMFWASLLVLEKICLARVSYLIGVTAVQLKILMKRCRSPAFAVPNYPLLAELPEPKRKIQSMKNKRKKWIIGISGAVIPDRGHIQTIRALKLLQIKKNIEFWVVGGGPCLQEIKKASSILGVNTKYYGYLETVQDVWQTIKSFDIGIIPNLPTANYIVTSVNRPYEYTLLGVPFLIPHYPGNQDIITELNTPNFDPRSPRSIANALEKMMLNYDDFQINDNLRKKFCWEENSGRKITEFYIRMISV